MGRYAWKLWAAATGSAGLLELPFPLAGPMPPWRSVFAALGLVPLLWAILASESISKTSRPLRRAFFASYLCGFLWYCGNCYWVRDTMMRYGDMPAGAPTLLLFGFSAVLGLYFAAFGLAVAFVRKSTGSVRLALIAAPFFWAALELAAARITSVPWDQLGYSQVDNILINWLAAWTGVYGISFLLVAVNALLVAFVLLEQPLARRVGAAGMLLLLLVWAGVLIPAPRPQTSDTAVLVQPNLDVGSDDAWGAVDWDRHMTEFAHLAAETCKSFIAGIPQTHAPERHIDCPANPPHPNLIVWPESPAPFFEHDLRFQRSIASIALADQSPMVVNGIGSDFVPDSGQVLDHVSAIIYRADGTELGRYDKIHLVPFGEYVPFAKLLFFAHKLTGRVSAFTPGLERKVFLLGGHRYGVFICYEAVFADEVRQFVRLGANVLVNISDDGWYGDTSAPWQHLNMTRMRAIENRRWILRDTNSGVTAVIDPYGRVLQSIPRHQVDALPARYGFRDDVTFYTAHGDVFSWACAILGLGLTVWCWIAGQNPKTRSKVRS
ncbi:MAG TPA: apolipoprotein N-acyltransferase [Terracidiphilus sp.]|nr:apolipoprotein N-acyltransferase [Terracidiphilus sp.]